MSYLFYIRDHFKNEHDPYFMYPTGDICEAGHGDLLEDVESGPGKDG